MALVLTIGGVDRTSVLFKNSIVIEQQAADFNSVCALTLFDADGDIAIAAEDAITAVDTATYFSGRVVDIRYNLRTANSRLIHLKCQDLSYQMNETVIDTEEAFPGGAGHAGITADADIIDHLFDTYLNTVTSDDFALNQTIQDPLTITFEPCTLRSALSQICTRTGGYFYIDFNNALHYFSIEASGVAWFLSDVPDDITSFGYLLKDPAMASTATTKLDGVFVVGAGVSGWRGTHAVGDRQTIVRDNRITTTTGRDNRGDAILAKYGAARTTYTVSTYKTGLRAGMVVRFVNTLYGVDATFTIRKMIVRWDDSIARTVYFTLTLGAAVNPSLIGQRTWTDTLDGALRDVSAPRLPTSSRGWTHDLVFSATDSDTVAWADAGVITLADGTTYTISPAANTGNMAAITYIYLDIDTSTTALQTTTTNATAVGAGKVLIAVAQNVADATKYATFQVFGGEGQGVLVAQEHIAALSVTTNEIAANTILAGNIAANAIETDELNALAVTAAKIAANTITADKISMGIGDGLFNAADGLFLLGPHSEINATEWWTLRRQKATLSGAFHREAGRWMGTRGLVIEKATTNLLLNPSIETNTTGWTLDGSTLTKDTTYSVFGDAALKVVTDNAGGVEGTYDNVTAETAASTEYTFSCYLRGEGTVRLRLWDDGNFQNGSVITLTDTWTRHSLTATFGVAASRYVGVLTNVQQNITFYCDGFQLEAKDHASSYCDGTLGTGYAWTGAAHGSTSTRTVTEVSLDTYAGLMSSNDTLSFRIVAQMSYDADATWPATGPPLFDTRAGADNNNRIVIDYRTATDDFGLYINGAYRGDTAVQTFDAGDWVEIIVTLDFAADDYNIYVNGLLAVNDTTVLTAPAGLTLVNLGSDITTGSQGGFVIDEFAIFDRVLTAIEVAGMYALQRPMVDMGALDKSGLYMLDGRFAIASSTSGARIAITADAITGYDSGGTAQFYLQSSDGIAYAGAGAVVLDENGIRITGTGGVADNTRRIICNYDQAGTEYLMSRYFGDWGGAGRAVTWVQSWCQTGDPWVAAGCSIILAAIDTDAGDDTRISIESSGLISVGGTQFQIAGTSKIHLDDPAEIEFDGATGNNLIEIIDNLADALHISSNQPMEFMRFITSGGAEAIAIDPSANGINLGVGMVPTADGIVSINLATENFEIMDAGSAGATEQDWIEVEIGGVQGFLHVFAAV